MKVLAIFGLCWCGLALWALLLQRGEIRRLRRALQLVDRTIETMPQVPYLHVRQHLTEEMTRPG